MLLLVNTGYNHARVRVQASSAKQFTAYPENKIFYAMQRTKAKNLFGDNYKHTKLVL